jgi:hypothetical protein
MATTFPYLLQSIQASESCLQQGLQDYSDSDSCSYGAMLFPPINGLNLAAKVHAQA